MICLMPLHIFSTIECNFPKQIILIRPNIYNTCFDLLCSGRILRYFGTESSSFQADLNFNQPED